MKIAVLGSGNGGIAVAADWALHGHDVSLFDFEQFPANIDAVKKNGGISCEGDISGFAPIAYAGHDVEKVLDDAETIFVVGPAFSTRPFAEKCKPYVQEGQIYIVSPSSACGAIVFKNTLEVDLKSDKVVVADTSTLPYACRITEPGKVRVFLKLKGGLYIAALPASHTDTAYDILSSVYRCEKAKSVLQTTLQNGNPVIHPSVTLLNAGRIENTQGDFFFYEEGVTPGVGRLMKAVDEERVSVAEKLGVTILPDTEIGVKQGYMQESSYETGYSTANGFKGVLAQQQLDHRYLNEDVGFGLVLLSQLGKRIHVETPVIDAVILLASRVMRKSYDNPDMLEETGLLKYLEEESYI